MSDKLESEMAQRLFREWQRQRNKRVENDWLGALHEETEEARAMSWHTSSSKFVWSDADSLPSPEPMPSLCPLEVGDTIEVGDCIVELIGKLDLFQAARLRNLISGSYVLYLDWSHCHTDAHDPYEWFERFGIHENEYLTGIEWIHPERNVAVYATGITPMALTRLLAFSTTCIVNESSLNELVHAFHAETKEMSKGITSLPEALAKFFPDGYKK